MTVNVLFFGLLRDIVGCREESLHLPAGNVGDVFEIYATRHPRLRALSASIVLALNQSFATPDTPLAEGDEVALLPPVSGGEQIFTHVIEEPAGSFFALTRLPIQAAAIARRLLADSDGAFVNFEGVVRNNTKGRATTRLEYECYEAMAVKMMAALGGDLLRQHAIGRLALVHRLGTLEIGETSVVVIATAPHRGPAFSAALDGINRLKKIVPIWKKEYFADGEIWVDGEWDDSIVRAGAPQP